MRQDSTDKSFIQCFIRCSIFFFFFFLFFLNVGAGGGEGGIIIEEYLAMITKLLADYRGLFDV